MNNQYSQKIVIIGGGFGGLYTALALNKSSLVKSQKATVTLVEAESHFLFTPLLYELLTEELRRWEISPSYQKLLSHTTIKLESQIATNIDLKQQQVILVNQQRIDYDYLAIAVGSENRPLTIPGADYSLSFRTLADVDLLEEKLKFLELSQRQYIRIAVVGGGANGVELACKLADRLGDRGEISLLERGSSILKHFSPGVKAAAKRAISKRKIDVIYQANLEAIEAETIKLNGQNMPIDLVIWTGGTQAREWIKQLPCQQNNRGKLLTLPTLQLLEYPEVFALGDVAEIHQCKKNIPNTAQAAYQAASCLATNMVRNIQGKKLKQFHYLHLGDMLTLGKRRAVISSFGVNLEGKLGDKLRRLVYICRMPTWRHRFQVLRNVIQISLLRRLKFLPKQISKLFNS